MPRGWLRLEPNVLPECPQALDMRVKLRLESRCVSMMFVVRSFESGIRQ